MWRIRAILLRMAKHICAETVSLGCKNSYYLLRMIQLAIIGAGDRTRKYLDYIRLIPHRVRVAAIAEPNEQRLRQLASEFSLSPAVCFMDWEELLDAHLCIDAAIIATPDHLHFAPAIGALRRNWHLLLEKPVAQSWEACSQIQQLARKLNRIVGVCHVMRYYPAYKALKERVESGALGTLISINHREPIGIDRMTHAFVRGIWNKVSASNPLILSKTCHDRDLICWLANARCAKVASFGSLRWFRKENAPAGSALRCLDCSIEKECRFSAVDLYLRRREWLRHFDVTDEDSLRDTLAHSPYGRCVYHCDNDVVDHQNLIMEFRNGIRATLTLDAFTTDKERTTHVMGTEGEVKCTETGFVHIDFKTGQEEVMTFSTSDDCGSYHYGSDHFLLEDFISAIEQNHPMVADLAGCLESHRIAFWAEENRNKE